MKTRAKEKRIHFLLTGGTIDGFYLAARETSVPGKISIIPHYIKEVIQPHFIPTFETLCMLDSGDITDTIRRKMVRAVKVAKAQHVVIVHGTNTMTKTAAFVDKHLDKALKKTVMLTGAMVPLKEFALSDGGFNLGFAIASLEYLEPGVYIAMNGKAFHPGKAVKNIKKARFEDA